MQGTAHSPKAPLGKAPAIFETKYFLRTEKVHISQSTGPRPCSSSAISFLVIFSSSFPQPAHESEEAGRVPRATLGLLVPAAPAGIRGHRAPGRLRTCPRPAWTLSHVAGRPQSQGSAHGL